MFLGDVVENLIDGDTAALLLGAGDISTSDDGLGFNLLHGFGFFVDLGLCKLASRFSTGLASCVGLPISNHQCHGQQDEIDGRANHAQLPLPQLL